MSALLSQFYRRAAGWGDRCVGWLRPPFDLVLRGYLWSVFFRAGWFKLSNWQGTLDLFDYFYRVPLLPPHLAAILGTAGEVGLSTLLLLGFCGRFAAAGLFVTNLVAALSLPVLPDLGRQDHLFWGTLLVLLALHGPGRWSLDGYLRSRRNGL